MYFQRSNEYCQILDPYDIKLKKNIFGGEVYKYGPSSFFLQPNEKLKDIKTIEVLQKDEALLLTAKEICTTEIHNQDEKGQIIKMKQKVKPGERWMVYGPLRYLPQKEIEIIERRQKKLLSKTEGIYVRNINSGKIYSIIGRSYLLKPDEELFDLELDNQVNEILTRNSLERKSRNLYEVVSYYCPFNTAVQIYDFLKQKSRIIFGPKLVMLDPQENFTISNLSGGKPKKPNKFQFFSLWLGPDFSTDIITLETSDHATLEVQLSYNWEFIVDKENAPKNERIFIVKDFIGDLCSQLASIVRSVIAQQTFENFHKNCARIVNNNFSIIFDQLRQAIFGLDQRGKIKKELIFEKNGLRITNVDIQNVSPVNKQIQNSLQKIVSLAIEATTNRQEANARQEAQKLDQQAQCDLEKQKIQDKVESELIRVGLIGLKSEANTVSQKGKSINEINAKIEAQKIDAESQLKIAELKQKANEIKMKTQIQNLERKQEIEQKQKQLVQQIKVEQQRKLAEIEAAKYAKAIASIGSEQIEKIAKAGPELQIKFLQGLGLKGYIIKDTDSPITFLNSMVEKSKVDINF